MLHAGSFTAADIQQIKTLFQDSLHAVEKDGTIRVHTLGPQLLYCVHFTSMERLLLLAYKSNGYYQGTLCQAQQQRMSNKAWQVLSCLSHASLV